MAHQNEFECLRRFLHDWPSTGWLDSLAGARVLNVGTGPHPGALDYRPLMPDRQFLSIDARPGPGVDQICDITGDCAALGDETFAAILCCSVLEHCARPWLAAANLYRLLMPAGLLYVSVPWIWRSHDYPRDYWRISADGIKLLFPTISWKRITYYTQATNEIVTPKEASDPPWRIQKDGRVYLSSQMLCMIGRKVH